jgi:ferric-dicitrate binding protein FerR (iron transport regulator)
MQEEEEKNELGELLEIYLSGQPTPAQWSRMMLLLNQVEEIEDAQLEPILRKYWESQSLNTGEQTFINEAEENTPSNHRVYFLRKWGWAAAIILLMGISVYLLTANNSSSKKRAVFAERAAKMDIAPGKAGAILTLADGSQVVLDSLGNGIVASQNGADIVLKNGQLTYDLTRNAVDKIVYNTMTTPKGRQFQLTLPDGTQVWLNAASSLRYPTVFTGMERKVEVTGEAYFEVAKNIKIPFRVNVNNKAEIVVLGTHFNVSAYENEKSLNTTLLEGRVSIQANQKIQPNVILQPGQQAQINQQTATGIKVVNEVDVDKVMAWRNGVFNFEGATLDEVMKQLERWYDIEVVYEKGIPNTTFFGKISRLNNLQELLTILEKSNVRFRLEADRRLIVTP